MNEKTNWTRKQDVMKSFGVSDLTIEKIMEKLIVQVDLDTQSHIKKGGYHNSEIYYDDYIINMIGRQLQKNQANKGNGSAIVKEATAKSMELGNLTLVAMEDPVAWEQFKALGDAQMKSIAEKKQLQLENQKLEKEIKDVYVAERQFHEKTYSATDIADMYNTTANNIGRIANKYNLKTDEFGFWSKSKASYCEKWVDVFRYNNKAIEIFEKEIC